MFAKDVFLLSRLAETVSSGGNKPLMDWQRLILQDKSQVKIVTTARRVGKKYYCAVDPVATALAHKNLLIDIVTPYDNYAFIIRKYVTELINRHKELKFSLRNNWVCIKRANTHYIKFFTNSILRITYLQEFNTDEGIDFNQWRFNDVRHDYYTHYLIMHEPYRMPLCLLKDVAYILQNKINPEMHVLFIGTKDQRGEHWLDTLKLEQSIFRYSVPAQVTTEELAFLKKHYTEDSFYTQVLAED